MQQCHTVTYHAFRIGKNRFMVEAFYLTHRVRSHLKTTPEGLVDSLEVRFENTAVEGHFPVPFASLPPVGRAMVRGVSEAALWELERQRKESAETLA